MKIIDFHAHITTKEYIEFLKKHNALEEDTMPIPSFDAKELISFMDQAEIEWCNLHISSPQPYFKDDREESIQICRKINEDCSKLKEQYPDRIHYHALLPLPDVDAAIQEAIYALDKLHADGIKLASNSRGLYLGDPKLDPLMEILNERKAVVNIHPHKPEPIASTYTEVAVPLFEFLVDTTRAVMNMAGHQVFERYPDIKFVVPHCGSFLPMIVERGKGLLPLMCRLEVLDYAVDMEKMMKHLYFDIAGYSKEGFQYLIQYAEISHIVYGSDYPFTPAPMILKQLPVIQEELKDHPEIFYENIIQLYTK